MGTAHTDRRKRHAVNRKGLAHVDNLAQQCMENKSSQKNTDHGVRVLELIGTCVFRVRM